MPDKELIDMGAAELEIAKAVALIEEQLKPLSPISEAQRFGLTVARAQLFGSFALIRIHNRLMEEPESST